MKRELGLSFIVLALAAPAIAQTSSSAGNEAPETVTVTGTRGAPRSAVTSLSPVDIISKEAIEKT